MEPLTEADLSSLALTRLASPHHQLASSLRPLPGPAFTLGHLSVLRLSLKLHSGEVSELSFLVKTPPLPQTCADFVTNVRAFYKEPRVYNSILKEFNNQISGKIGPECYLARPDKVIVLDNVFDLGYRKVDIKREFNLQHCELVLDALAKLHAGSLVLEETKSQTIPDIFPGVLFETVFSDETNHPGFDFMCTGINTMETLFTTHFTHFPKSIIKETMTLVRNLPFKLKPSVDYKNVLNHGGVWAENALFAYGIDGNPTDIRLVDFSNARYAPPACDVLLFLHLTTSRAFRELHQGALLTHYYSKLAKEVQSRGFDLAEILPWAEFEASIQHYLGTAIVGALMHVHTTLLPEDTLAAVVKDSNALTAFMFEDRSELVLSAYSYDESYRRRLSQALVQVLEYTQFRGRRRSSVYISA